MAVIKKVGVLAAEKYWTAFVHPSCLDFVSLSETFRSSRQVEAVHLQQPPW